MRHGIKRLKRDIRMSLQQKTLLMLIILLLFFCMIFMIATSIISKRTEDDFKIRTSETAVSNVVSTIRASLVNYNYLSRLIMVNDRVVSFLKAVETDKDKIYEARRGIYEIQNLYSYIDSVYIFRNDGEYVSTGIGEYFIDINSLERSNILDARGTTVISINGNGTIKKNRGKPFLTMSRAIYDIQSQKLLGILIMNISSNVFDDTLALQNSSGMCILDSDGTLLCGNKEIGALYDSDYNSDSMVYKNIRLGDERKTLTGRLAVKPLVVLCASGIGAEALPRDTIYALMLTLTAFILSGMVCAWFITVNIARPIRNLSAAMERTRSSGWLKKIDTEMPNNEIGRLAESYNSMIEYLNELFNRLLENEKNVQKAEIRVLQEQVKPHFLYNTLETISYMAVQENASKAHDALETLGSFYRNFLSKGDREIPLKRELRITQDYLSLQKLRYGNIFEDEYILDDSTLDYMIPKLILQPLVENCIYHGVRLKGEKCVIRITTCMEEDGLHIIVYDSGVGMSTEQITNVLEASEEDDVKILSGFGLRGTISRIRYYYDCDNVVQIRSEPGEYTEIEIYIPKMREKE
ncbi:MAG: two component system histidine kinase [Herbinix sp.]|nr:two component system histidine kinase [Herbinix sp.]